MTCIHKLKQESTQNRGGVEIIISGCQKRGRCVETDAELQRIGVATITACESCEDAREPEEFFDRVVVINLQRRPDRLAEIRAEFAKGWPFAEPTIMKAIDGKLVPHPDGYTQGEFAWACFQSHRRALEDAINDGCKSVLILEDDATISDDFATRSVEFMKSLPADWQFAWLGGHHMKPPIPVKPGVVRSVHMDRCHAYAARGQGLIDLYKYWHQWHAGHCDWALSEWIASRPSYCAQPWLVGQRGGYSDIHWSHKPPEWWHEQVPEYRDVHHATKKEMLKRIEFNFLAYPCQHRGELLRIENKPAGDCALTDAPCFQCFHPKNEKREASLWQFCKTQIFPTCNRCNLREPPADDDEDVPGDLEAAERQLDPKPLGPFAGAPVQLRPPVSGLR